MDVTTIEESLGRIEEGLAEARMATELLRDGDVTAISELDAGVDAMAREIAELKTRTSTGSA
ncbi:MAG: hypothetical protein QOK16_1849 [Solirubrobacteraceae bacterium]|jgi:precorrin-3B methylase|nr:hypothetical protein [Solirubrobacteraceae bacterium]